MERTLFFLVLLLLLAGCGSTIIGVRYEMAGLQCEAKEIRPSWFSNLVVSTCLDAQGKPLGLVSGTGIPLAQAVAKVVEIGAEGGLGGAILSNGIPATTVKIAH